MGGADNWQGLCSTCTFHKRHNKLYIDYPNGDTYFGEGRVGRRHGWGVYSYWTRKELYDGEWMDDRKTGYGTYRFRNGDLYSGEWLDDVQHGRGISVQNEYNRYEGLFFGGRRHGVGMLVTKGASYLGGFRNGKQHGRGIFADSQNIFCESYCQGVIHHRRKLVRGTACKNADNINVDEKKRQDAAVVDREDVEATGEGVVEEANGKAAEMTRRESDDVEEAYLEGLLVGGIEQWSVNDVSLFLHSMNLDSIIHRMRKMRIAGCGRRLYQPSVRDLDP
eukprot:GHVQ01026017.1.p1 GENE.GHVQ01026017.1~~GHVQ01026017.1.p1  ORF type:complete len:278 (+),score=37.95 GHVQ01026017.1:236-1069(+)